MHNDDPKMLAFSWQNTRKFLDLVDT